MFHVRNDGLTVLAGTRKMLKIGTVNTPRSRGCIYSPDVMCPICTVNIGVPSMIVSLDQSVVGDVESNASSITAWVPKPAFFKVSPTRGRRQKVKY